jgi:hypothetical protein
MIGQYLPNNNEKSYSAILPKFLHLNTAIAEAPRGGTKKNPALSDTVEYHKYYICFHISI